tara:strand:- start:954 stop:1559 length:606 start_codon:yes stop_codon:yes gene_type:complete
MMMRTKKIKFVQIFLFFAGISLIFLTYISFQKKSSETIISKETKTEINTKIERNSDSQDTFYNIEYSGIDLAGNRYILKAEEANNAESNTEFVNLKFVDAKFYFKDDTVLYVTSDSGLYNNKTLDMIFEQNVKGKYTTSQLFAEKAEYSNSEGFLTITKDVMVKDIKGTITAEKLTFDLNKNKLDINSSIDKKINANLNYK